jgi:hypothetical protein
LLLQTVPLLDRLLAAFDFARVGIHVATLPMLWPRETWGTHEQQREHWLLLLGLRELRQ